MNGAWKGWALVMVISAVMGLLAALAALFGTSDVEMLIIALFGAVLFYTVAATRKAPSLDSAKPKRLQSFTVENDPQLALKTIVRFAQTSGYHVENIDEDNGYIVLSHPATMMSVGFFYPIYLTRQSDGTTLLEVGIEGRLPQVKSTVSRHHEKCVNGIKAAFFAEAQ